MRPRSRPKRSSPSRDGMARQAASRRSIRHRRATVSFSRSRTFPKSGKSPPPSTRRFPVRRMRVDHILDDFFFDQDYEFLIGASRATEQAKVIDLAYGHKVAEIDLPGMPHLGSGITWERDGVRVMATPHLREGVISVIDMSTWQTIKRIETLGPGFFMRSHETSPYVWADVFFGPNRDAMHVIDKQTLEIGRASCRERV